MTHDNIGKFEGSHIYIFDSIENPKMLVLATNPYIGHVAIPGFGKRKDISFEEAAIKYTEKQTGLVVDKLRLLSEWDNDGKPFKEPNGITQYVKVRNYIAQKVEPKNIDQRIREHRETENGKKYKPEFVEISSLRERKDVATDVLEGLKKYFDL